MKIRAQINEIENKQKPKKLTNLQVDRQRKDKSHKSAKSGIKEGA